MSDRTLPSLNALRAFEAAARLGGLGRAATELHVTHGAVSRHIKLLEEDLDTLLLVRDGRGLRLTPAGRDLRDAAGTAFEQIRASTRRLRRGSEPGTRVLGCPGSLLARWVIPRLDQLQRDLPDLKLHLSPQEGDFDPALPGLDAALMIAAPPWPEHWKVRTLAPERIGPVINPRHPEFARLSRLPPAALLREDLLHTTSRPQAWPQWARGNGLDPGSMQAPGTEFDHLYYLLEAALAGLGVAIAPQPLVADDIAAGRLAAPWDFVETDAVWCLCTRSGDADTGIARLAAWMSKQLAAAG